LTFTRGYYVRNSLQAKFTITSFWKMTLRGDCNNVLYVQNRNTLKVLTDTARST